MKCIENVQTLKLERIGDDDAFKLVATGEWRYVPKRVWKASRKVGG